VAVGSTIVVRDTLTGIEKTGDIIADVTGSGVETPDPQCNDGSLSHTGWHRTPKHDAEEICSSHSDASIGLPRSDR
jgi:hypothetical protein